MAALSSFIVTRNDRYAHDCKTNQLLQNGGTPEYVHHDRTPWRAVFVDKNMAAKDSHKEMTPMYSEHCLSRQAVLKWVQKFSDGRTSIEDEHRVSQPVGITMLATLQQAEDFIQADKRVTIDAVATTIGCSHGQSYNVMHEQLGFHKVCSRWVPYQLTPQHKSQRMGLSLQHLKCYQDEGDDTPFWIVTGDESWVHHYEPEMKHASMQ